MPKVLRIIHRLSISGPTHHAAYLSKYLPPPFETKLLAGNVEKTEASGDFILKEIGVEPIYIPKMLRSVNPFYDTAAFRNIRNIIKEYKPDIVHTHASKSGALGRMAAHLEKVPVILHTFHGHVFHGYYNKSISNIFVKIERGLARYSDRIIAISNLQKKELAETYKICRKEKIEVVPLGFDLGRFKNNQSAHRTSFRQEFKLKDNQLAIGIIGRLTAVKNQLFFLKAFAKLKNESSKNVVAFVVGDGEDKQQLLDFCIAKNLKVATHSKRVKGGEDVIFTSWREDMPIVLNGLDVVALTSLNEGTPVVLIEAQAAQKPIVSTNVGGINDIVQKDKNALLSASEDADHFYKNLKMLCENDDLRNDLANYHNNVIADFGYNRLVSDIQHIYEKLLVKKNVKTSGFISL